MKKLLTYSMILLTQFLILRCTNESEISIEKGGINGIITNKLTGEPISGANLTLSPSGLSKISGSDGRYEFQDIETQQYSVQASATGYTTNFRLITVSINQSAKCDIHLMPK